MTKNQSGSATQKEPGAKPARKPGADLLRLVTFAGVAVLLVMSIWIWRSTDRVLTSLDARLSQIENRLAQVAGKVDTVASQTQPPRRGPEPTRVYTINTAGAPAKGPAGAPITIAEFSDFQ